MEIFARRESAVRSYCRTFPAVFTRARGVRMEDENGRSYLDFLSGAGALNYGHNPPELKAALVDYLTGDGVVHSLDLMTAAKGDFLEQLERRILEPRGLDHRVQFTGPTGTNAIEAALKAARRATGRRTVLRLRGGFHGMTLGALAMTDNPYHRDAAGVPLPDSRLMPFEGDPADDGDGGFATLASWLERAPAAELPAAVLIETVQGEGGVRPASDAWLARLADLLAAHGVLWIADEVQVGCGRTGTFFSFESCGRTPDLVVLSKSISGYGLPLALVLLRPELDGWRPGEHNGTFRGHNPAFVTGAEALRRFWSDDTFERSIRAKGAHARARLERIAAAHPGICGPPRGRGLILGLPFRDAELAARVSAAAFEHGLIIERSGPADEVVKLLPPLVISESDLDEGIDILAAALAEATA